MDPKTNKKEEKRSYRGVILAFAAFVIMYIGISAWNNRPGPAADPSSGSGQLPQVSRPVAQATVSEPAPSPEYGTVLVSTDAARFREIEVRAGDHFYYSPVENVAYDVYIDGQWFKHYPKLQPGKKPEPPIRMPYNKTVGFLLSPGQGINDIRFAYWNNKELGPAPKNWYPRALNASQTE